MRLVFWADGFWPRIGGRETQGLQFVEEMQKRGHECLVLAQRDSLEIQEDEIYQGIIIKRFDFNRIINTKEIKLIKCIHEYLSFVAKEFCPDVIYLNTLSQGSAFVFLLFRKLFPVKTVLTVHTPCYGEVLPPLVEQICSHIDLICCASKWGYYEMRKVLPMMTEKFEMIYYGLRNPTTVPTPLPFSPPTILLLGRLSSEKGFEVGIQAFALLQERGVKAKLLIAGSGEERPFLESLVDNFKLQESVRFTGGIQREGEDVESVINASTFVVMPSHIEPFGLVALESMRMGRPVIASNVGGLPEIVTDQETGFLVPPNDPQAFCNAMLILLQNPEKTIEMGRKAQEWGLSHFLLEDNVDRYEQIFTEQCLV